MRIVFFIILFLLSPLVSLGWFLLPLALYLLVWPGYELLIIGIVIDSFFGIGHFAYVYTVAIGLCVVCGAFVRPYMSWHNQSASGV